jgi:hypothetical protein
MICIQAVEAAMFIRMTRRSDLTILLADLNAGPDTLVYRVIIYHLTYCLGLLRLLTDTVDLGRFSRRVLVHT